MKSASILTPGIPVEKYVDGIVNLVKEHAHEINLEF